MNTHRNTKLYQGERRWFFAATSLLMAVFIAYVYFLSASVYHVVVRKELSQEIAQAGSHVSELESQYIAAQHAMSEEIASQEGFVETGKKVFIERHESSLVLSDNNGG